MPDLPLAGEEFAGDRYGNDREFMAAAGEVHGPATEPPFTGPSSPGERPEAGRSGADWHPVGAGGRPPYPPGPARLNPPRYYPAEIAHESAGGQGDVSGSATGMVDWGGGSQGNSPGDGAPKAAAGTAPRGTGGSSRRRRPPRVGRATRRLRLYAAVALVLGAGLAGALVKVTSGGPAHVALSGNGANATPAVRTSIGVGPVPSAAPTTSPSAVPSTSTSTGTNLGVQVGSGESGPGTLAGVLAAANSSVEGRGLLPLAKCDNYQQNASGAVVCTDPVAGVAQVFYQNYSSLQALYDAYQAEVTELDGGTFRQNTGTCGDSAVSYAEFGWNQEEGHPHDFTIAQMASGDVGQMFALGRMACFATRTPHGVSQDIVWTVDNGLAMGVEIGSGSPRTVYQLWAALHHTVLFRGTEFCGTAERMNLHDIPTGNLKVLPVCPPGVQALPASPPA